MDLGVLLESPQWSQSSSPVGACTYTFLPRIRSSVTLPVASIKGSVVSLEAFPRGFPSRLPTLLSHMPQWCESILGMKVQEVQGKQFPLEWTDIFGGLLEWWHDPGVPLAFPVERQGPFGGSNGKVGFLSRHCSRKGPHLAFRGESPVFS